MEEIKIIGIGSSGISITNRLIKRNLKKVLYSVIAADKNLLELSSANEKLFIDNNMGGFAGNAKNAENATIKYQAEIKNLMSGSKCVVIISALGGGTGSGITPFVVKTAQEMNIPNFAIVINPFNFENEKHKNNAKDAINKIKTITDNLFILENQKIYEQTDNNSTLSESFEIIDDDIVEILNKLNG